MFDIEKLFTAAHPALCQKHPKIARLMIGIGRKLWKEDFFQQFAKDNQEVERVALIDKGFEYIDFDFLISEQEQAKIPETGRLIIVSNHPLGLLDGIGFIRKIRAIRPDVKLTLNGSLCNLLGMQEYTIPIDNFRGAMSKTSLKAVYQHLQEEGVIIVFPAGLISKLSLKGITDREWTAGFLHFALHNDVPVLPMYVDGRNSRRYYFLAWLAAPFAKSILIIRELLLSRVGSELFTHHRHQRMKMRVGDVIAAEKLRALTKEQAIAHVRQAVYQLK